MTQAARGPIARSGPQAPYWWSRGEPGRFTSGLGCLLDEDDGAVLGGHAIRVLSGFHMVAGRGPRSWEQLSGPHQPGGTAWAAFDAGGAARR